VEEVVSRYQSQSLSIAGVVGVGMRDERINGQRNGLAGVFFMIAPDKVAPILPSTIEGRMVQVLDASVAKISSVE
jgi:hypothetical protein